MGAFFSAEQKVGSRLEAAELAYSKSVSAYDVAELNRFGFIFLRDQS